MDSTDNKKLRDFYNHHRNRTDHHSKSSVYIDSFILAKYFRDKGEMETYNIIGRNEMGPTVDKKYRKMSVPEMRSIARRAMELSEEENDVDLAFAGAEIYAGIGKPHIAIKKLNRSLVKIRKSEKDKPNTSYKFLRFLEKNPVERKQKGPQGLEGKTAIFALTTLAGIALSVFSFRTTGNAISGVVGSSQGLFGIFLFVFGLTGIFFNVKK